MPLIHKVVFVGTDHSGPPLSGTCAVAPEGSEQFWVANWKGRPENWCYLGDVIIYSFFRILFRGVAFPDQLFNYVENYKPKVALNGRWISTEGTAPCHSTWERFFLQFLWCCFELILHSIRFVWSICQINFYPAWIFFRWEDAWELFIKKFKAICINRRGVVCSRGQRKNLNAEFLTFLTLKMRIKMLASGS